MELAAAIFALCTATCLLLALPFARNWARDKQKQKAAQGEYSLPVASWLARLSLISMSMAAVGLAGTMAFATGLVEVLAGATSFLALVVGLVGSFIAEVSIRNRKKIFLPIRPKAAPFRVSPPKMVAVQVPQILTRYKWEFLVGMFLSVMSLVSYAVLLGYLEKFGFAHFDPSLPTLAKYGTVGMVVGLQALLFRTSQTMLKGSNQELRLIAQNNRNHFVLSEWGIECSIGLIEGECRLQMRRNQQAALRVPWSAIAAWSVEPARRVQGRSSPPYYKITLHPDGRDVFILRQLLAQTEVEILTFVRHHLCGSLELQDSAYEK